VVDVSANHPVHGVDLYVIECFHAGESVLSF